MREKIERILNQFGASLTIEHEKEATDCRGFLRPVTGKYWQNMEHQFSELGQVPRGQYIYIGPASVPVTQGDRIVLDGVGYALRRCEVVRVGDSLLYYWGLCVREGEDTWNN